MKSKMLFAAALGILFLCNHSKIYAQKHCDLSLSVDSPAENQVIPYGDTAQVYLTVKNNGPDTMLPTDTFYYTFAGSPGLSINYASIPPGDSVTFIVLGTSSNSPTDQTESFCFFLVQDLATSYVDTNSSNDSACVSFVLKGGINTGISKPENDGLADLQIFPNPATGDVTFSFNLKQSENVSVSVYDLVGRRLLKKVYGTLSGQQEKKLNISNLQPGLYFVQFEIGNSRVVRKLEVE